MKVKKLYIYNKNEKKVLREIKKGNKVFYNKDTNSYLIIYTCDGKPHSVVEVNKVNGIYAKKLTGSDALDYCLSLIAKSYEVYNGDIEPLHEVAYQWVCGDYILSKDKVYEIVSIRNRSDSYTFGCESMEGRNALTQEIETIKPESIIKRLTTDDVIKFLAKEALAMLYNLNKNMENSRGKDE